MLLGDNHLNLLFLSFFSFKERLLDNHQNCGGMLFASCLRQRLYGGSSGGGSCWEGLCGRTHTAGGQGQSPTHWPTGVQ